MKIQDVNSITTYVEKQIKELTVSIVKSEVDKVLLKNILENCRSILDYLATDIALYLQEKKKKVYFPYGRRENHFKKSIERNLPSLRNESKKLYNILEERQPYKSGSSWLVDLCELTNEVKHRNLNKTSKSLKKGLKLDNFLTIEDTSNIKLTAIDNYINGKKADDVIIDKGELAIINRGELNFEIITNEIVRFQGKDIEILPFLEAVISELIRLKKDIYSLIFVHN